MSPSKVSNIDFTTFYNIIDGEQRSSKTTHNGINPATQEKLWDVPVGSQQDVDDAVKVATKAFKSWSAVPIEKRHEMMKKFIELFSNYEQQFTDLMCKETGKPVSKAIVPKHDEQSLMPWHSAHVCKDGSPKRQQMACPPRHLDPS